MPIVLTKAGCLNNMLETNKTWLVHRVKLPFHFFVLEEEKAPFLFKTFISYTINQLVLFF